MYFQYHSMYCLEVLHQLLAQRHDKEQGMMPPKSISHALFEQGIIGKRSQDIFGLVVMYSAKILFSEADGLKAFSGSVS